MKIDIAIEALTELLINARIDGDLRRAQVLRLAIEGLNRVQDMRLSSYATSNDILPGETEGD